MSQLLKIMFLLPYGARLLTPSTGFWIFSMCVVAYAMALAEGFTWGEIFKVNFPDRLQSAVPFAGIAVGMVIFFMDATFIMLDVAKSEKKRDIKTQPELPELFERLLSLLSNKLFLGVLFRLAVVVGSMVISAPFLADSFDEKRVLQEIEAHNKREISVLRQTIASGWDKKLADTQTEDNKKIAGLERLLTSETAGIGPSGKPGKGATAQALQDQLDAAKMEARVKREALEKQKAAELGAVDSAAISDLAKKYPAVSFWEDNYDTRKKIQGDISYNQDGGAVDERRVYLEIESHNNSILAKLKEKVADDYDRKIDEAIAQTNQKLAELRSQQKPVVQAAPIKKGGKQKKRGGKSIKTGITPSKTPSTAPTLETEANKLRAELSVTQMQLTAQKNEALQNIDLKKIEDLINEYPGVDLWKDDAATRDKVKTLIGAHEGPKAVNKAMILGLSATKVMASALFGVLFVAMVIFKLFAPRSVRIYYDENLQEQYANYLRGFFDSLLDEKERHDGLAPMQANRFEHWFYEFYSTNFYAAFNALLAEEDSREALITRLKQELPGKEDLYASRKAEQLRKTVALESVGRKLAGTEAAIAEIEAKIAEHERLYQERRVHEDLEREFIDEYNHLVREEEKQLNKINALRQRLSDQINRSAQLATVKVKKKAVLEATRQKIAENALGILELDTTIDVALLRSEFEEKNAALNKRKLETFSRPLALSGVKQKISELTLQILETEAEIEVNLLRKEFVDKETELKKRFAEWNKINSSLQKIRSRIQGLNERIAETEDLLESHELDEAVKSEKDKLDAIENEQLKAIEELSEEIKAINKNLMLAEESQHHLNEEIRVVCLQLQENENEIKNVEKYARKVMDDPSATSKQGSSAGKMFAELEEARASLLERQKNLQSELKKLAIYITDYKQEKQRLEGNLKNEQEALEQTMVKRREVEARFTLGNQDILESLLARRQEKIKSKHGGS